MPVVPTYDNLQTAIRPASANVSGPAPGAIGAEQVQQMGRALSESTGQLGKLMLDAKMEANDLRVHDALNQAVQARTDAHLVVTQIKGRDALERPDGKSLPDEASQTLQQQFDALRDGLGNDAQRTEFQKRAGTLLQQFRSSVGEHVSREYQSHRDDVEKAGVVAARRQADADPGNPVARDESLAAVRGIVDTRAKRLGWTATQRDLAVVEAVTPIHVGAISYWMTRDVDQAQAYFKANEGQLDAKVRDDVRKALEHRAGEVRAGEAVRNITAAPGWGMAQADQALVDKLSNKPEELKMARAELRYQHDLRQQTQAEDERAGLAPVQKLLGDALNAGRAIRPSERDQAIGSLRIARPDLYARAAGLVDKHNDEIRNEGRAAAMHARQIANLNGDAVISGLTLKYDMLTNPGKYRNVDLGRALLPLVKSGGLKANDVEELMGMQAKMRDASQRDTFATLMSGTQYLDSRLDAALVNGTSFLKLPNTDQAQIKAKALTVAEPLLQALQTERGKAASKDEVKAVIDSLFTNTRYRNTFLGATYGDVKTEQRLELDTAATRLVDSVVRQDVARIPMAQRSRIEQAMRSRGLEPTPDQVLRYWQAGQAGQR